VGHDRPHIDALLVVMNNSRNSVTIAPDIEDGKAINIISAVKGLTHSAGNEVASHSVALRNQSSNIEFDSGRCSQKSRNGFLDMTRTTEF
jgi:hypothetical protein